MKKTLTFVAVAALAVPMAVAVPSAIQHASITAQAASTKKTYTVSSTKTLKAAKAYHTGNAKVTVYKAALGADRPTMTLSANGQLKANTTYHVTKTATVKLSGNKHQTYAYVKGQGWVLASNLKAGQATVTYTVSNAKTLNKAKTAHATKATTVYKAAIAADAPKMSLTANGKLSAQTNVKVTKTATLTKGSSKHAYSYVEGHGWVLSSSLKAGKATKAVTYTVSNAKTLKAAKAYHTNSSKVQVYSASIAADAPKMTLKASSKLAAKTNVKVTKQATLATKTSKHVYDYVQGHGWVLASNLKAGNKSVTYTVSNTKSFSSAKKYYTKSNKPVVYKSAIAADAPKMTLTANGHLKAHTNYRVTKQATLATKNSKHVYSLVKGQGWVLKSSLTAGTK